MDQEILIEIENAYNLSNLKLVQKVEEGALSNNYIVESNGVQYFLKHHRHANPKLIKKIHKVENFFSEKGFPVILSLPNIHNELFTKFGNQYYGLLPFHKGDKLVRGKITGVVIKRMAKLLADLHKTGNIGKNIFEIPELKPKSVEGFLEFLDLVESVLSSKTELAELDDLALKFIELKRRIAKDLKLKELSLDLPNIYLVHGDFHEGNVFIDSNNKISALFDFEKTEMMPRAAELIRSIIFICFHGDFEEENYRNAEMFIKEYNSNYPLPKEELGKAIKAIYGSMVYNRWILEEAYLKNNSRPLAFLKGTYQDIKYLSEQIDEFERKLLSFLN